MRWIAEQARAASRFLLYLPLTTPHTPLAVNAEWRGRSGINAYADLLMETDAAVGHVLDALQQGGVADETFVLFSSDNGCSPFIGLAELEKHGHHPSGPLRGYKSDACRSSCAGPARSRHSAAATASSTRPMCWRPSRTC